jgi:hypothetical protein
MEIKLSEKESEEYFYNSLCNGLGYFQGNGLELRYEKDDYKAAKQKLAENRETPVCFEEVLMEILREGKSIMAIDDECDGEYTRTITLKEVHERVQNTPADHLLDMVNETDDASTADVILQTVFFNEVIFG